MKLAPHPVESRVCLSLREEAAAVELQGTHVLRIKTLKKLLADLRTEQQPSGFSQHCLFLLISDFLLVLKVAENPFPGLSLLWNRLVMML